MLDTPKSKRKWLSAKGMVYSVDWIDPTRNDFGHYNVVYSYHTTGELRSGKFSDYGKHTDDYLRPDDMIDILYDPTWPERSYYPQVRTAARRRVFWAVLGLVAGIIALLCAFLNGTFR